MTELTRREAVTSLAAGAFLGAMPVPSASTQTLTPGSKGTNVAATQRRLNALGYWCGEADGTYGAQMAQAVMALQKVAGLARDGQLGPKTAAALAHGARPSSKRGGNRIEIDKRRQILMVVRNGRVTYIINTSTGNGSVFYSRGVRYRATTPSGEFTISRGNTWGWEYGPLGGLFKPYYFNGGIAIHGSASIPGYPASHGCCRTSVAAQNFLISKRHLYVGERVSVY